MDSISHLWSRAQALEQEKRWQQAKALYEGIIASEPYHVPARLRLSRFEQFADRYLESKQHLWRAVDAVREHSNTRNIAYVTARLLEFAEEQEAAALIMAVNRSDPHVIRQAPSLAQHLWLAGHYEDALGFIDEMHRHVPAHPLLSYTRGNVLRYLGDMEGARREYETAISLSPAFPDAHWSLSTHARSRPPLARVERIIAALASHPAGSLEQAHLYYALFREYDAADRVDDAWSALSQGAAIMRQRVVYDPQQQATRAEALMQAPVSIPASPTDATPVPVFIVGMPRTGTTLLDRMLGNHSAVKSLGERNDLSAAVSESSGRFFRSPLLMDGATLLQQLDFSRVGHLYLQRLRMSAPEAAYVIDKNPQNLFNLPIILQALPGARVLCLQREPMDACFSNLKELFQGGAYPYSYGLEDLADHYVLARKWTQHWESIAPQAVRTVSYEDLVTNPETVMSAVLDFVGLEPQGGLHDVSRNTSPVATASSSQVREGVHHRGVEAWKRYAAQLQPLRARLGL